jgi:hypothetical protein
MSATFTEADERRLLELEREMWRRECRGAFLPFCVEALRPQNQTPARHHRLICAAVEEVARGACKRLLMLCPPGSGKTTYTSRLFPAWYFAHRPSANIIACSHTQEFAETNSGHVQRIVNDHADVLGYQLRKEAKGRWDTSNGCDYLAGSVGSAILGFRADIAIIDDPFRSRADAESETMRESLWEWFTVDLTSRLKPGGRIVLIATAFHEDDLMGRIQRRQGDA